MDTKTYAKARAQGISASHAYRWANTPPPPELDWTADDRATTERDGFDIAVTVTVDMYADLSWLGEFTNEATPGAILSPRRHAPSAFQTAEYFVPTIGVEERRRDLSRYGYSKGVAEHMAREQVREDARRACELTEHVISVVASREGITLGSAAVCGVDLGEDWAEARRYVEHEADELIPEAIEEANQALNRLFSADEK